MAVTTSGILGPGNCCGGGGGDGCACAAALAALAAAGTTLTRSTTCGVISVVNPSTLVFSYQPVPAELVGVAPGDAAGKGWFSPGLADPLNPAILEYVQLWCAGRTYYELSFYTAYGVGHGYDVIGAVFDPAASGNTCDPLLLSNTTPPSGVDVDCPTPGTVVYSE